MRRGRSAARWGRSSRPSSSCATARTCWRSSPATHARTRSSWRAGRRRGGHASRVPRRSRTRPDSLPVQSRRSPSAPSRGRSSTSRSSGTRSSGSAPGRRRTWPRSLPRTCSGSRARGAATSATAGRVQRVSVEKEAAVQATEKIWMNGELVDWDDARIHVGTHGLHYGSGVFEGIRCYDTPKGPSVFRLSDHLQRLHNSARLLHMPIPYTVDELKEACNELIGANGLPECSLRPIAFYGFGELGVAARGNPVETVIMSWPWGAYLG